MNPLKQLPPLLSLFTLLATHASADHPKEVLLPLPFIDWNIVNWQDTQDSTEMSTDYQCLKWTISDVAGQPTPECLEEDRKYSGHYIYRLTGLKDIRETGCPSDAGWTIRESDITDKNGKYTEVWLNPFCEDWVTHSPSLGDLEAARARDPPETIRVQETIIDISFDHRQCDEWGVEFTSEHVYRPTCKQISEKKKYRPLHTFRIQDVLLAGRECKDWRIVTQFMRSPRDKSHPQTMWGRDVTFVMPFCNDPGSINQVYRVDGRSDAALVPLNLYFGVD